MFGFKRVVAEYVQNRTERSENRKAAMYFAAQYTKRLNNGKAERDSMIETIMSSLIDNGVRFSSAIAMWKLDRAAQKSFGYSPLCGLVRARVRNCKQSFVGSLREALTL